MTGIGNNICLALLSIKQMSSISIAVVIIASRVNGSVYSLDKSFPLILENSSIA